MEYEDRTARAFRQLPQLFASRYTDLYCAAAADLGWAFSIVDAQRSVALIQPPHAAAFEIKRHHCNVLYHEPSVRTMKCKRRTQVGQGGNGGKGNGFGVQRDQSPLIKGSAQSWPNRCCCTDGTFNGTALLTVICLRSRAIRLVGRQVFLQLLMSWRCSFSLFLLLRHLRL